MTKATLTDIKSDPITKMTKFTLTDIKSDHTMQKFFKKKMGLKEGTKEGYLYILKEFCNFTEKTPTEIHDLHLQDLRNRVPEFDMWLSDALDDYVSYLIEHGKSHGTIKNHISKIKSYFHTFKLKPTPTTNISVKHVQEDSKYALTVEDIRKAVRNSNPTYQALFITLAQTGLSISDALLLDVKDFVLSVSKKDEILAVKEAIYRVKTEDNIIGCLDLRRKKSNVEFYTFIGPEALKSISLLLEARKEEDLKPEMPLFLKDWVRISKKKEGCIDDLRLNQLAVDNYTHRMHKQRGIFPKIKVNGKERNYFRPHKIRHWFSNQLKYKAGFNAEDTKYLMGQKTGDVLEHYININNYNALKGNYRKALPYLAIIDEIILEENQEAIEKLKEENQKLNEQLSKITAQLSELDGLGDLIAKPNVRKAMEEEIRKGI